jgi:hypothetical protein
MPSQSGDFLTGNAASTGRRLLHADSVTNLHVMNARVHRALIRVIWLVLVWAYPSTHRRQQSSNSRALE